MVWRPVFGIFYVRSDVDACDCTRGLYGHGKNLHWKLTLGEKSLAASGTQTRISIVPAEGVGSWFYFSALLVPGVCLVDSSVMWSAYLIPVLNSMCVSLMDSSVMCLAYLISVLSSVCVPGVCILDSLVMWCSCLSDASFASELSVFLVFMAASVPQAHRFLTFKRC